MILGRYFLSTCQIKFDFGEHTMSWLDIERTMTPAQEVGVKPTALRYLLFYSILNYNEDELDSFATELLPAEYKEVNVIKVAQECVHLTQKQRDELQTLLLQFPRLFDGKLGKCPHQKLHIDIDKNVKPVHARPYTVPHIHHQVFKDELKHLCTIGVLELIGTTEWAAPRYIIPKNNGTVRFISDFRALNKAIRRKVYPLPNFFDVLSRRSGYEFFSKIDMSMMYYNFELNDESSELCTIITPFGKYRYKRLPMGIKLLPRNSGANDE
jgi:hypothetical protein